MHTKKIILAAALTSISSVAMAGGPLYIHEESGQPYKWNTSNGSIPVYVDSGELVADKDGNLVPSFAIVREGQKFYGHNMVMADGTVLPAGTPADRDMTFVTIERANEITAMAISEWSNVSTATLAMHIEASYEEVTGGAIVDVTGENADEIYEVENGYGFWVNYDTDGSIIRDYFGASPSVLGIAFPEWADEATGEITEATAVMNGYTVYYKDDDAVSTAGVFTHEFGHAMNMSHSQANGDIAYRAFSYAPKAMGVLGCEGVKEYTYRTLYANYGYPEDLYLPADAIETMFPFINNQGVEGVAMSTVNVRDDIVNLSDLYPAASYKAEFGTIRGRLFTKEGMEYSGVNLIARNLDDPYEDVVSQQSGNLTQGAVGPDGYFEINGLTPGGRYVLYTNEIQVGGYPTTPMPMPSGNEYWNDAESSDPALDDACDATEIVLAGGEVKDVEIHVNGYLDGIQYTPLVAAFVTDLSKNGQVAVGSAGSKPFIYNAVKVEIELHPEWEKINVGPAKMNKNGTRMVVLVDPDENGIQEAGIWDLNSHKLTAIDDLTGNECGTSGSAGKYSSYPWAMDATGDIVVGSITTNDNGDQYCGRPSDDELNAFVWTKKGGMQRLPDPITNGWVRADGISGDGSVITGHWNSYSNPVAWIDGEFRDVKAELGAVNELLPSFDGRTIAFTNGDGAQFWNPRSGEILGSTGGFVWCQDVPLVLSGRDYCALLGEEGVWNAVGKYLPMLLSASNDDLTVIGARAGDGRYSNYFGAIYVKSVGWMTAEEFFHLQGVGEAVPLLIDTPYAMSGNGSEMMAGIAGAQLTVAVDMDRAFVCDNGMDVELPFPHDVIEAVEAGAVFGRCAFID